MGFKLKFIRERKFVLTLIQDEFNDKELMEGVRMITRETEDMHPFVELADVTGLHDLSALTESGVTIAGSLEFDRKHYKQDKVAILVASDEAHRLATRYISTSIYFRYDAKIFRDFSEAITWLGVADIANQINDLRNETG